MVTGININNINSGINTTVIIFKMPTDVTVSCCRNVALATMLKAVVTSNGELTPSFRYIADLRQQKR